MDNDSAATKRIERASFQSGFKADFTTLHGEAVYSRAFTYTTPEAAHQVDTAWARTTATQIHNAKTILASGSSLGPDAELWTGTLPSNGHNLPVYVAQWARGRVIAGLVVAGGRATLGDLLRFAHAQDARLTGHPVPNQLNGEAAKSAVEILADARSATASARSVHFHEAAGNEVLDFHSGQQTGEGTVVVQPSRVERIRRIGRQMWINANKAYYSQVSATVARRVAGHWLLVPPSTPSYIGPAKLSDLHFVADMITAGTGTGAKAPRNLGTTRLNGQLVIVIHMFKTGGLDTTVYVPADGTPWPIVIDQAEPGEPAGHIELNQWNRPLTVRPPLHPVSACTCG